MFTHRSAISRDERGQVAVLAAVLIALLLGVIVAVGLIGHAAIERSNATVAADAIALASVADPADHREIVEWYRDRGFGVASTLGSASIAGDHAQARSYATADNELTVAPAVVAVLARAGQLVGQEFQPMTAEATRFALTVADARSFDAVAAELGVCRSTTGAEFPGGVTYELC